MEQKFIGAFACFEDVENPTPGQIVYVDEALYMYSENNAWEEFNPGNNVGLNMNLYELNKNLIAQLDPMTKEELDAWYGKFIAYKTKWWKHKHFMLLCKDYNYYTIFEEKERTDISFGSVVIEILEGLGTIYSIENKDDHAIEIWIKPVEEETPYAFYLFPYENGVVYYG
jgi:hypothetical protein